MDQDKKKQIAVIGDEEFTLGFKLAGVEETYNPENYREKIQELVNTEGIGIIVAHDNDLEQLPKRVRKNVEQSVAPVVVSLSETAESERLQQKIKTVIGADIT